MRDIANERDTSSEKISEKIKYYEQHIKKLKKSLNKVIVERNVFKKNCKKEIQDLTRYLTKIK